MTETLFLCLIMLICIRAIGLGVSIDFFYDSRDSKFLYFIFGWSFWIIANIFPIFSELVSLSSLKEFFLILNIIFALIGFILYIWGFFKYYMEVPVKIFIILVTISILLPLIIYIFIGFKLSIRISVFFLNILFLSAYIVPPLKRKRFVEFMGKSIRWYYTVLISFVLYFPVSIITFLMDYQYGLYNAEDPLVISLYYIPSISSTALLIVLLVHLEYTISSREKFGLKDKYSHNLGNIMQTITSSSDLIKISANLNNQDASNLNLINKKCKEASRLIKEIRKL